MILKFVSIKTWFIFEALKFFRKWPILENLVCLSTDSPSPQRSHLASPRTPLACNWEGLCHWGAPGKFLWTSRPQKAGRQTRKKETRQYTHTVRQEAQSFLKPVTSSLKIPMKPWWRVKRHQHTCTYLIPGKSRVTGRQTRENSFLLIPSVQAAGGHLPKAPYLEQGPMSHLPPPLSQVFSKWCKWLCSPIHNEGFKGLR